MKSFLNALPQEPLTPEREQELLAAGDTETIVLHALLPAMRYVNRISRHKQDESLSLCYSALSKAIKNFRLKKGKFISYAIPYLRGEVCAEWRRKDTVRDAAKHETPLEKDDYPQPLEADSVEPTFEALHWRECWEQVEPLIRDNLTAREMRILEFRYKHCMTLQEIADQIGVTRERVRQIEDEALQKIRGALPNQDKSRTI